MITFKILGMKIKHRPNFRTKRVPQPKVIYGYAKLHNFMFIV